MTKKPVKKTDKTLEDVLESLRLDIQSLKALWSSSDVHQVIDEIIKKIEEHQ
jgi:hypothetical protein